MSDIIYAPWTDKQVEALNFYQKSGRLHPYTCGGGGGPCSGVDLVATNNGWVCPQCGRLQTDVIKDIFEVVALLRAKTHYRRR